MRAPQHPNRVVLPILIIASVGFTACATPDSMASRPETTGPPETALMTPGSTSPYDTDRVVMLDCESSVGLQPALTEMDEAVLDAVRLPTRRAFPAPAPRSDNSAFGFGSKHGLIIRPGAPFDLIVPIEQRGHASLRWGAPGEETTHLRVNGCTATMTTSPARAAMISPPPPGEPAPWLAFAGGYMVDHPMCLPIIVQTPNGTRTVHIGMRVACPGQDPPVTMP